MTNAFVVSALPNPLCMARLDHHQSPPDNAAFYGTGVAHCFLKGNIYFWGDPERVSGICTAKGWGHALVDAYRVSYPGSIDDWGIVQVLLYRAFNEFLRSNGFSLGYNEAYMGRQPKAASMSLVYRDTTRLPAGFQIHEGFRRSFSLVEERVYLVLLPLVVITERTTDGRRRIRGPGSSHWYTKITYWRRADKEREMIQYWPQYLSGGADTIIVPIAGSSPLSVSAQGVCLQ
jgi:hypothetical protein